MNVRLPAVLLFVLGCCVLWTANSHGAFPSNQGVY
jgi:hypothetical protein